MSTLKERLAKKRKDLESRGGNYPFFRVPEGSTRFRNVPVGEEKDWAIEATVFYLGKDIGYIISPITFGDKCALMKAYNELSSSKDEDDKKFAKRFKPSKKFFTPCYRYKDDKGKEVDEAAGVKLLMLAGGQYQDMIDLFLDDEAGDFTSRLEGYDLKHKRTGKGMQDTEYTMIACKSTKAFKAYTKEDHDPEEMLRAITPSYKETKEMLESFMNLDPDDDADKDTKKKGKSSGDKKKKRKIDL